MGISRLKHEGHSLWPGGRLGRKRKINAAGAAVRTRVSNEESPASSKQVAPETAAPANATLRHDVSHEILLIPNSADQFVQPVALLAGDGDRVGEHGAPPLGRAHSTL